MGTCPPADLAVVVPVVFFLLFHICELCGPSITDPDIWEGGGRLSAAHGAPVILGLGPGVEEAGRDAGVHQQQRPGGQAQAPRREEEGRQHRALHGTRGRVFGRGEDLKKCAIV